MSTVHVVVPAAVADPARPSGGNTYDRRVRAGLASLGWTTLERRVEGTWPGDELVLAGAMADLLAGMPDGALVLLDGLLASPLPEVLVPASERLRLVVLVHLPLGLTVGSREELTDPGSPSERERRTRESAVLQAAAAVVTTSRWTRDWLATTYGLESPRVHVVPPGVQQADLAEPSPAGSRLLSVGAVTSPKGHDVLVEALAAVTDLEWSCRCVGSTTVDPAVARRARSRARDSGIDARLVYTGPLVEDALAAEYAVADLVVAPSRTETYGMVVTEALARGVPVVGADVGGLPEALGLAPGGDRPGVLVTPDDPGSLAAVLRDWLSDARLRHSLRAAARARRGTLSDWSDAAELISTVLSEAAA